jgi:ATP-dependent Clp protease ATP-binding subunit ClpB
VLLDEIEKAHPDTFNVLLQVLDDGRLTDNKGRVANFKNTLIIMTSNMGAEKILDNFEGLEDVNEKQRQEIVAETEKEVMAVLKENLRPEFLNRIDETIVFHPLSKVDIRAILNLLMKGVNEMLKKQELFIYPTDAAFDLMASDGYEPQFGARPLKRTLQRMLINELSKEILQNKFQKGDQIVADARSGKMIFEVKKK